MSYLGICKGYEIAEIPSITDIGNVMSIILKYEIRQANFAGFYITYKS